MRMHLIYLSIIFACLFLIVYEYDNAKNIENVSIQREHVIDSVSVLNDSLRLDYLNLTKKYEIVDSLSKETKTNTIVKIKTVYKDSVREVYIERNDYERELEKSISTLQDSLTKVSSIETKKEIVVKHDTLSVDSTIYEKDKFYVYAKYDIGIDRDKSFIHGFDIGANYMILDPIFLNIDISKYDKLKINAGIGVQFSF